MNDAAIAGEHAAVRRGYDVACWRDAILQFGIRYARSFTTVIPGRA